MLGNFVVGASIMAPAAMLAELSDGLSVTIRDAGLLITFGAVALCISSPLAAWLTSRFDRRALLTTTLAVTAVANAISAIAPDYAVLLTVRLIMLAVAALYTPQAAGTVGLIVPVEKRGGAIAYLFLGWSLAAALGLPLLTFICGQFGWRIAYGAIAAVTTLSAVLLAWRLPRGLFGTPVDLKTWMIVGRNGLIMMLLLITVLQMSGQFVVFTFMAPLLTHLTGAGSGAIGVVFATYGVCGFIGNVVASRMVDSWGGYKTSLLFVTLIMLGLGGWALGSGHYLAMACAVGVWGLGFASSNSMQQVRLVGAAPALAAVTVSLNTSVIYVGQAVGSAIGALLYTREMYGAVGYVGAALAALALLGVISTRKAAPAT